VEGPPLSFAAPASRSLYAEAGQGAGAEEVGRGPFPSSTLLAKSHSVVSGLDPGTDIPGSGGEMLCGGVTGFGAPTPPFSGSL